MIGRLFPSWRNAHDAAAAVRAREQAIARCLATPDGLELMAYLIETHGVLKPLAGPAATAMNLAYREGARCAVLDLLRLSGIGPRGLHLMSDTLTTFLPPNEEKPRE